MTMLYLEHNARRMRDAAELLSEGACTMVDFQRELGVSANDDDLVMRIRNALER